MNIIFGNFGNPTVALMQWARARQLTDVYVVSIDTGWAAQAWQSRVDAAEILAVQYGFQVVRLQAPANFSELITLRGSFPTTKLQWCAGFLKGSTLLTWLDEIDVKNEATILLAHRKKASRINYDLTEKVEASDFYGERRVWYPLLETSDDELKKLVEETGLDWLSHRSLECDPCVNNSNADHRRMAKADVMKTQALEASMESPMFSVLPKDSNIEHVVQWARKKSEPAASDEQFDMGCGSPYGCGM